MQGFVGLDRRSEVVEVDGGFNYAIDCWCGNCTLCLS